ncbi:cation diffusion facilitator family transporter [Campylobacter sp. VBCF_02 NA5]|uniref:cation diffusion facilitator family transporter n=1 Tax=unclassified Campylobacter TaxID=2593542 RepID=UPI0022E9A18E|nr:MULTISPECIES: cation diffusion facilitator family transporter [unclassified Campylobacter]MDA3060806.1 cation diffusion facilitator family transporter [Campylobacter sp. VBCF_02 NA5]MDA3076207.1 cation diffusion facilitator family transporter [Campylobacter sp. JMF_04 NA10]
MTCKHDFYSHKPIIPSQASHSHSHSHGNSHSHEHFRDHAHSHHDHSHAVGANTNKKMLKICIAITIFAMIFQFVYSIITNSLALLSDTLHMFSHAFALTLSYFAVKISEFSGGNERTFGCFRAEILVAFVNSIMSFGFALFIVYEAVCKLINPESIDAKTLLVAAFIGLVANAISGLLLIKADMQNINIKSSFIHMMSDLLSSVGVILGAVIVYFTGAFWVDCVLAMMIAFVIGKWSYSLAKDSVNVLLETSPIPIQSIKNEILSHEFVLDTHDIHLSEITHNFYVLTAHIVIERENLDKFSQIIGELSQNLMQNLRIAHCTFQPEWN